MRSLSSGLLILLSLINCGCALVPPNVEGCGILSEGAACAYTIDGPTRRLSQLEWDEKKLGNICFGPQEFGEIKKFLLQACVKSKKCDIKKVEERIVELNEVIHEVVN